MKILFPIFFLIFFFVTLVATHRTLAPVDLYEAHPVSYRPGIASGIKNTYVTDIVEILLPWKYYLTNFKPKECETQLSGDSMHVPLAGIILPQGTCYPIWAVRRYSSFDSFFLLSKFLPFFAAYDFSYLLLLSFLMVSAFWFFTGLAKGKSPSVSVAWAVTLALSFPVARDLQYDIFSAAYGFFLLSVGFLARGLESSRKGFLIWAAVCFLFALFKTSLQGLGIFTLLYLLTYIIWLLPRYPNSKKNFAFMVGIFFAAFLGGLFWHKTAMVIFISSYQKFLPSKGLPLMLTLVKRILALGLGFVQTFFGGLIFSFDTVDFSKVLGDMGAKDYYTYDSTDIFLGPLACLTLLSLMFQKNRKETLKRLLLIGLLDVLVIVSPLYRLLYFRFHQWWMLTGFAFICADSDWKSESLYRKKEGLAIALTVLGIFSLGLAASFFSERILTILGTHGTFGFDPGFWTTHLNRWIWRATFRDVYSWIFWLSICVLFWLKSQPLPRYGGIIFICVVGGLSLNICHYNTPQSTEPFFEFIRKFNGASDPKTYSALPGKTYSDNIQLLVNRPPKFIYESLTVEP